MEQIPAISFSAWSGTGKTTIIEQLILHLKELGYHVAVIKHDAHNFDIDKPGKDSYRFTQAGADITILNSNKKTALIEQRSLPLYDLLDMVHDVDLILVEGFNNEDLPQIGISRRETGKGFRHPINRYVALITDELPPSVNVSCSLTEETSCSLAAETLPPVFSLTDIEGISNFITDFLHIRK